MSPSVRADEALTRLDMSEREIKTVAKAVTDTGILNIPHSFELEKGTLGSPGSQFTDGAAAGCSSETTPVGEDTFWFVQYSLPMIEGYDYEVRVHAGDLVVGGRLVRRRSSKAPIVQGSSSLHSWSHVASEVLPHLSDVELLERLGSWEIYEADLAAGSGQPQRIGLRFVLELLQEIWIVR